jgi:hypothetical protein
LESEALNASTVQIAGAVIFLLALLHTFSTAAFQRLAHRFPRHEGSLHLLGEVEVVFGLWAMVLVCFIFVTEGREHAVEYVDGRNFTEPLFVFAIMVVAGSRPILQLSAWLVDMLCRILPIRRALATYFLALSFLPLLGSFITEPGAMTLAALLLRDQVFSSKISERAKYATLGVLFVNISIGGTLTSFAAPPVLMVATKWNWDSWFMLSHFGWRAAIAVLINASVVTMLFHRALIEHCSNAENPTRPNTPPSAMIVCALFLLAVVAFSHHPAIFMGILLFFIGYSAAYPRHHDPLILREALLVAFFLAGLVVLGGQQQWWLQPVLTSMSSSTVFYGATALTAVTDNAALTYLGSTVEGLSDPFKYALVAGAVTGGGLTVIANAPNPAGLSILRSGFRDGTVNAMWLLLAAIGPTLVSVAAFRFI